MSFPFAVVRYARRVALAGLMAAGSLLPVQARAAGDAVHEPERTTTAGVKPTHGGAQHKISPHLKARLERAQAQKPEHRPNLRFSVRGTQKASRR